MKNLLAHCAFSLTAIFCVYGCSAGSDWPFHEEKHTLAVTQRSAIEQRRPILTVLRDSADGQWTFLADENPLIDVVVLVTLEDMVKIDTSLAGVADLPPGWKASRPAIGSAWQRTKL